MIRNSIGKDADDCLRVEHPAIVFHRLLHMSLCRWIKMAEMTLSQKQVIAGVLSPIEL